MQSIFLVGNMHKYLTLYIHNTILNSANLIGLPHFDKYLNYTGYISYITHYVALMPLFSLNVVINIIVSDCSSICLFTAHTVLHHAARPVAVTASRAFWSKSWSLYSLPAHWMSFMNNLYCFKAIYGCCLDSQNLHSTCQSIYVIKNNLKCTSYKSCL